MKECCSPTALRSLSGQGMKMAKGLLTMATIKPLFVFSNLGILKIHTTKNVGDVGFDLDNESVELFVPAWPHAMSGVLSLQAAGQW